MSDKILRLDEADRIDALEAELLKQRRQNEVAFNNINELLNERDELAAALQKVADADFALSLHKQHDTLSYLKHMAKETLAKLENTDD